MNLKIKPGVLIDNKMTERQMFEKSFQRPTNYFKLSSAVQWKIDNDLGILDWNGDYLSKDDIVRFKSHYKINSKE